MKKTIILLALLLTFTSCEKDEVEQPQQTPVEVVDPCTELVVDVETFYETIFNGTNNELHLKYRLHILSENGEPYNITVWPPEYEEMLENHEDEYCFP